MLKNISVVLKMFICLKMNNEKRAIFSFNIKKINLPINLYSIYCLNSTKSETTDLWHACNRRNV